MKKNISALLYSTLMILSMTGLNGCDNSLKSKPDFTMPEGGFDTSKEVEIKFYHTMNKTLADTLDAYITEFNKVYPNIKVNHQQIGGYDDVKDQITTQLSANGNDCDVAYCYPDHLAIYNKTKALVSLDTLINDKTVDDNGNLLYGLSDFQKSDFITSFYEEGKALGDGVMYTLPWSKSSEVMYYNKTYFTEKQLSVPDHWFTKDDNDKTSMEYICKYIHDNEINSIPLGYDSDSNWFITMCEQYGSGYTSADKDNHYLFDNETNRGFVKKFKEWYDKGYVTTKSLYGSYTSSLFTALPTAKEANPERSYMSIGSSAGASNQIPGKINNEQYFEVGVAPIPQINPANPKVISQGPSVCIFRNTDPQKVLASWLFVKYFTTNVSFQASFSMASGYTPVIKSVEDNSVYKAFLDKNSAIAQSTKQCLAQQNAYFISPAFAGSSDARTEVGEILSGVMSGAKTIDEAFADAINELEY